MDANGLEIRDDQEWRIAEAIAVAQCLGVGVVEVFARLLVLHHEVVTKEDIGNAVTVAGRRCGFLEFEILVF